MPELDKSQGPIYDPDVLITPLSIPGDLIFLNNEPSQSSAPMRIFPLS